MMSPQRQADGYRRNLEIMRSTQPIRLVGGECAVQGVAPSACEAETRARQLARAKLLIVALVALLPVAFLAGMAIDEQSSKPSPGVNAAVDAHVAHGGGQSGSGVAIEVRNAALSTSRGSVAPGPATLIVRNEGARSAELFVVPTAAGRAIPASTSKLHEMSIAAIHEVKPGERRELAVDLKPGTYTLVTPADDGGPARTIRLLAR